VIIERLQKMGWIWVRAAGVLVAIGWVACASAKPINVKLTTMAGEIRFELYLDKAPVTVANFLKYIDGGHFSGGSFYRVVRMDNQEQNTVKIEVIQGGLAGKEGAVSFDPIVLERTNETGLKHRHGTLSMARSEPDSGTSEFFICLNDQPSLDYGGERNPDGQGFAAFGKVVEGMDVVLRIQEMKTIPSDPDKLEYTSGQSLFEPVQFLSFERE